MKIFNKFKINFLSKAYTEGVYADTPQNRKLGRVGMTYAQYAEKQKGEQESNYINIQNDDNVLNIKTKDGYIKAFKDENIYYLEEIKINKESRGKGIGKKLLKIFIKEAKKDSKFNKIFLQVQSEADFKNQEENKNNNQKLAKGFYIPLNFKYQTKEDEQEISPFLEYDLKRKPFTIEQIKEKVQNEIKKLKRKNDYVTLSDNSGNTYRFSYNRSTDEDGKGFNECLVKNKKGNVLKTFKNSHEEDLMNSVYKYIQSLDTDIIPVESGGSEEVSIEHNTAAIKKKMQEAKDSQTGTILVKGSGGKLIYLNRDRKGRWLKDFNNYTIRDSKRNIISQGKADSEEELINKLNEYLSKNKIKLEV